MSDFAKISAGLTRLLALKQKPVAVCFSDTAPVGIEPYSGHAPAGCRFWQDAAVSPFTTVAADHRLCAVGLYTHNLDLSEAAGADLKNALEVFDDLRYVTPADLPLIPVLKSKPGYVTYAPLDATPLAPDVVLLLARPKEILILSEAVQQVEKQNPPAMGRPACAVIPQVSNDKAAAISFGCCGARAYLDTFESDLAIVALPGDRLEQYFECVEALARANQVLTGFHNVRKEQAARGESPTVAESLAALHAR
jgi:uncharacterized protein (DUF169 family)